MENEIKELQEKVNSLLHQINILEGQLTEAEEEADNFESDIADFTDQEISDQFYLSLGIRNLSVLDELKIDLFFEELQNFSLEQFELFIKTTKK